MTERDSDLLCIKKSNTESGKTEVHILGKSDSYRKFTAHYVTALDPTDHNWAFCASGTGDLYCIKKKNTGANHTEIHVLSASSNYQKFIRQTVTALEETDDTWAFGLGHGNDLICIKKSGTASNHTEVHVLKASDDYKTFSKHVVTALPVTDNTWDFAVNRINEDVWAIKKANTGSGKTEVHILNPKSDYNFEKQSPTAIPPTDASWAFCVSYWGSVRGSEKVELMAIKKQNTGTHSTEINLLPYDDPLKFDLQTGTSLSETDGTFAFCVAVGSPFISP